jgi:2-dehydro-3-deoxygluconokinase
MSFDWCEPVFSRTHEFRVVDRIGAGDSFASALLHVCSAGREPQQMVEFATAAAVWKHTILGEWVRGSWSNIEALAKGVGGAVVRR